MRAWWGRIPWLGILVIVFLASCRTPPPDLKPKNVPEVCSDPPDDRRYNSPYIPKEAFKDMKDPMTRDPLVNGPGGPGGPGGMSPSMGASGMGMSPGSRPGGY
jgi:hypothetical protein